MATSTRLLTVFEDGVCSRLAVARHQSLAAMLAPRPPRSSVPSSRAPLR